MPIPYRTITQIVSFEYHGMTLTGRIEASRTMLGGSLCRPRFKALGLVQIPLICCQASPHGLLDEAGTGLSGFGLRVARRELERACSWKSKNRALQAEAAAGRDSTGSTDRPDC